MSIEYFKNKQTGEILYVDAINEEQKELLKKDENWVPEWENVD